MGLIGTVGRRSARVRAATVCVYLALTLGAVTTLYPFAVMFTTGFKGPTDQNDNRLIPTYWSSESELYRKYVDDKYAGNLGVIAATRGPSASTAEIEAYRRFLLTLPPDFYTIGFRQPPNGIGGRLNIRYQTWLRTRFQKVEQLNRAYIEEAISFETVQPPTEAFERMGWKPTPGPKWSDWLQFRATLPAEFRVPITTRAVYQNYIRKKYRFSFPAVPASVRGDATAFNNLVPPTFGPNLRDFETNGLPPRFQGQTVETLWLASQGHSTVGDPIAAGAGVTLPIEADEHATVHENSSSIRGEFETRNFAYVLRYLTINGHALWTTILFCGLSIVVTLCVNGIAAYALSRYPITASGKILVFLLATMAFPAEVTMIPNFLLLKNLHLLNTFAALVLPGAASGFMIFMLKGFFDSLPPELFEAAALDGAPETTMLRRIALPLSRPVFGYFALMTFLGAYGTFIYAFLIAQDRRMWTIMVFLYELSVSAPKYVMMAAFTLAALPTMLIFLFAQRTIMRGIVLPSER